MSDQGSLLMDDSCDYSEIPIEHSKVATSAPTFVQ